MSVASSENGGETAYDSGCITESSHRPVPAGTTSIRPPRPCARIDTASCTITFIEPAHDAGESNPSSVDSNDGQSGSDEACSSITFTWSPCRTARLTNLAWASPRWCFTTSKPGSETSTTHEYLGMERTVPQTASVSP